MALTANTSESDRQACHEAGMNGFVTKPIQTADLFDEVARLLPGLVEVSADADTVEDNGANAGLDTSRIEELADGDEEFFRELWTVFLDDGQGALEAIRSALDAGDLEAARRGAHRLKGSAGNIGAVTLQTLARELEAADVADAESRFGRLAAEFARLRDVSVV
jgi:HPt (histidine-containing phosphotransfer) domain-containing protein